MKKILKTILIISIIFPNIVFGAPSISGVSGTIVDGQSVTISGSDFGNKESSLPILWDDFESGVLGQNPSTAVIGGSWSNGNNVIYVNDIVKEGSQTSARHDFTTEGIYNAALTKSGGPWGKLYISFFYRTDYGNLNAYYDDPCRNYKIFRMEGDNGIKVGDQGEGVPLISYEKRASSIGIGLFETALRAQYEPEAYSGTFYSGDHVRSPIGWANQEWHRVEFFINIIEGEKEFRMWEDNIENTPSKDSNGWVNTFYPYMGSDNSRFNELHFGMYFSRDNNASAYVYTDDIYIDKTIAHIEIGNQSTYELSTHREVQIPYIWEPNSVSFSFNQGSFQNGDNAYLYIIDEDGEVNQAGYPIAFVSSAGDTVTPIYPTGLNVL